MDRPPWAPLDADFTRPSTARVYDALLGGTHHFEIDRLAAENGTRLVPDLPVAAKANRRFLRRAVTELAEAGVRQFLDIGSGIPTVGHTHEAARAVAPEARVVYADLDPIAVAQSEALLEDVPEAAVVRADVLDPQTLLGAVEATGLIDFGRPVAVLLISLLHLLPDELRPDSATAALRTALAPGSHLAISHLTSENRSAETARLSDEVARRDQVSLVFRPRSGIQAFFGSFEMLEPGLVPLSDWRPDAVEATAETARSLILCGVGRKG